MKLKLLNVLLAWYVKIEVTILLPVIEFLWKSYGIDEYVRGHFYEDQYNVFSSKVWGNVLFLQCEQH